MTPLPTACPKPTPESETEKRTRRIASLKKLRASQKPIKRSAPLPRAAAKRRPARKRRSAKVLAWRKAEQQRKADAKAVEFARVFGSVERVTWIKSLPCLACLLVDATKGWGEIENAHVTDPFNDKGMGRRANHRGIAPLCRGHHVRFDRWLFPFNDPNQREYIERHAERIAARRDAMQGAES